LGPGEGREVAVKEAKQF
jgi:hypothetical protein